MKTKRPSIRNILWSIGCCVMIVYYSSLIGFTWEVATLIIWSILLGFYIIDWVDYYIQRKIERGIRNRLDK